MDTTPPPGPGTPTGETTTDGPAKRRLSIARRFLWFGFGLVALGAGLQAYAFYWLEDGAPFVLTAASWGVTGVGIVIYALARIWTLWERRGSL